MKIYKVPPQSRCSILVVMAMLGSPGCAKKNRSGESRQTNSTQKTERTSKKRPTPTAKAITLQQCLASKSGSRITVEGFISRGSDVYCNGRCSLALMPRVTARAGARAVVRIPKIRPGGKNGMVKPKQDFKPKDLLLYDVTGKRVRVGQPVRLSGKLDRIDASRGYKYRCRIDVDRVETIARITTSLYPAQAKRVPLSGICKSQPDDAFVRVQGFAKLPTDAACLGDCEVRLFENGSLSGRGLVVGVLPGDAPNRLKINPPILVGAGGAKLSPAKPVVVQGVILKLDGMPGVPLEKGAARCTLYAEQIWQAKP